MRPAARTASALLLTVAALGCDASIPLLPQWTADLAVPIDQLKVGLSAYLSGPDTTVTVPPGVSQPINSPPTLTQITGTVKTVFEKIESLGITDIRLVLTFRKSASAGFAFADTLIMALDTASLASSPHRYAFAMAATDTMIADTIQLTGATVQLLGSLGQSGGSLATKMVGRASTLPGSPVLVRPHDVVTVSGLVVANVPFGGRK